MVNLLNLIHQQKKLQNKQDYMLKILVLAVGEYIPIVAATVGNTLNK